MGGLDGLPHTGARGSGTKMPDTSHVTEIEGIIRRHYLNDDALLWKRNAANEIAALTSPASREGLQ